MVVVALRRRRRAAAECPHRWQFADPLHEASPGLLVLQGRLTARLRFQSGLKAQLWDRESSCPLAWPRSCPCALRRPHQWAGDPLEE